MTTKFNKDMYAKMRSKKDEPLSNLGKKIVRMTGKGPAPIPLSTIPPVAPETMRTASPTTSIEEIATPGSKRQHVAGKGKEKEKADIRSSTIWDDERLAVDRAHEVVTPADLRALSDMSLNDVVPRHVHKLVQVLGESLHITTEYLTQEAKVVSLTTRMEALEKENSDLKKNLITSMDEATSLKEKVKVLDDDLRVERKLTQEKDEQLLSAKEKLATIAARSVEAFQTTDEYNTVFFSWYFKGFELLRRYLVKHPSGVNMESLDLEEVDKEMALDEAAQSFAPDGDAPEPATDAPAVEDAAADA
ncbi:uncharacterized protein LOC115965778 [Quercus lobata]|uniref:uncharacterized protein LOC115965778 n=1 Tax=Quercus lobata TaxID=97700 RepID=UPI0012487677|nr:uncharacterized protein LOC115965778 [Quercus lobata]XP_030940940.1 uncharacterized protein LOC115965778 [Quercus lobata]